MGVIEMGGGSTQAGYAKVQKSRLRKGKKNHGRRWFQIWLALALALGLGILRAQCPSLRPNQQVTFEVGLDEFASWPSLEATTLRFSVWGL